MFDNVDPRPNSTKLLQMLDDGLVDPRQTLEDLVNYLSDDEVGDFMHDYDLTTDDDDCEEDCEEDY